MRKYKVLRMLTCFVSIVMITASITFVGCFIDLEPETKEFMEEVQGDCLALEDDLHELVIQIAILNSEILYLYDVLEAYGWEPPND